MAHICMATEKLIVLPLASKTSTYPSPAAVSYSHQKELLLLESASLLSCTLPAPQNSSQKAYVRSPQHRQPCRQVLVHTYFCSCEIWGSMPCPQHQFSVCILHTPAYAGSPSCLSKLYINFVKVSFWV